MHLIFINCAETSADKGEASVSIAAPDVTDSKDTGESKRKYRKMIFGREALTISPNEPYCLYHPIRRGHFNVSPHYSAQRVCIAPIFLPTCLCRRNFLATYLILLFFRFLRT